MSEGYRQMMWHTMMSMDGQEIELVVQRERIERDATFSEEAMERLYDELIVWIGTRIMRRWDATREPPSLLAVEVKVTAA